MPELQNAKPVDVQALIKESNTSKVKPKQVQFLRDDVEMPSPVDLKKRVVDK